MSRRIVMSCKGERLGFIGGSLVLCVTVDQPRRLAWRFKGGMSGERLAQGIEHEIQACPIVTLPSERPFSLSMADALCLALRAWKSQGPYLEATEFITVEGWPGDESSGEAIVPKNTWLDALAKRGSFGVGELLNASRSKDVAEAEAGHGVSELLKRFLEMNQKKEL